MEKELVSEELWTAVDDYVEALFLRDDPVQAATLADSVAAGLPQIAVSPAQGKLLMLLAKACGARRILEIGTLGGYSAIWLARALPEDGRLVSLELEPKHAAVARANLERAGLAGHVDVRVGPALESLAHLAAEGGEPFDFVFIDADKPGYINYLEGALRLARPGALIVADNVVRQGKVLDPAAADASAQGARRFNDYLAAHPRLSAVVLQTVGSKGHDGFAIALVGEP